MQATIRNFLRMESAGGIVLMGALQIAKPLFLWVNDGLMAMFFFLVGLELKREFLEGELSRPANVLLPAVGAVGAIIIIAIFYSTDLSTTALVVSTVCLAILSLMNWRGVSTVSPYILVGTIMWIAVLPLFAFVNAGISLEGVSFSDLLHTVPLGIAAGLFVGKQVGIFLLCFLAIKMGIARLPEGANWGSLYGVSVLCGVGFTMSLFVGSLAFENVAFNPADVFDERLGIILGSLLSGVVGYVILQVTLPKSA